MLKAIRYTLAAICLAASVGCLALWWRSLGPPSSIRYVSATKDWRLLLTTGKGVALVSPRVILPPGVASGRIESDGGIAGILEWQIRKSRSGVFGRFGRSVYFPLWYPALVFALAAVAAIRIRRFTLRSGLVGMSVVAVLLGMPVTL